MPRCAGCRRELVGGVPGHSTHQRVDGSPACSAACAAGHYTVADLRRALMQRVISADEMQTLVESHRFVLPALTDAIGWNDLFAFFAAQYPRNTGVWYALSRRDGIPPEMQEFIRGRTVRHLVIEPPDYLGAPAQ